MKIHVFITYDVAEPSPVPGSVARTVAFEPDIAAHRLVQLAQDTAQEVAIAYLRHVADQPTATETKHWTPEPGERVAYGPNTAEHGKVVRVLTIAYVDWDEGHRGSHELSVLRQIPKTETAPQSAPCIHRLNELGHCTRCGARPNDAPQGAPRGGR